MLESGVVQLLAGHQLLRRVKLVRLRLLAIMDDKVPEVSHQGFRLRVRFQSLAGSEFMPAMKRLCRRAFDSASLTLPCAPKAFRLPHLPVRGSYRYDPLDPKQALYGYFHKFGVLFVVSL